jgi:hypothetical protein
MYPSHTSTVITVPIDLFDTYPLPSFFITFFIKGYVRSVLGNSRSLYKNESQLLASALRANYPKMFSNMIRKYFGGALWSFVFSPPPHTIF